MGWANPKVEGAGASAHRPAALMTAFSRRSPVRAAFYVSVLGAAIFVIALIIWQAPLPARCSLNQHPLRRVSLQVLHSCIARDMGRPFRRSDYFWSAKRPRSLLEKLGVGVESDLIDKKNLGSNKPDC